MLLCTLMVVANSYTESCVGRGFDVGVAGCEDCNVRHPPLNAGVVSIKIEAVH